MAEKEAAWRSFSTGRANPRSPQGRALAREQGKLYTEWKEVEKEKERAIAGWYRKRNEAAYAESPDKLIEVALEDAKGFVQENGFTEWNYPHNAVVDGKSMLFGEEEELFLYSGSVLNYLTGYSGLEHMCGIYAVSWDDGSTEYISGPVVSGMETKNSKNGIIPFAASFISAQAYTDNMERIFAGAKVKFEGILHSHPSYESGGVYDNNDSFSWGDGLAALLAGKIWLTTQDGSMYALNEADAAPLVLPALICDIAVTYANHLKERDLTWDDYPQWLKDFWPKIERHDANASGRNFELLDVKSYDARNMP